MYVYWKSFFSPVRLYITGETPRRYINGRLEGIIYTFSWVTLGLLIIIVVCKIWNNIQTAIIMHGK